MARKGSGSSASTRVGDSPATGTRPDSSSAAVNAAAMLGRAPGLAP